MIDTAAVRAYLLGLQENIVLGHCRPKTARPFLRKTAGQRPVPTASWTGDGLSQLVEEGQRAGTRRLQLQPCERCAVPAAVSATQHRGELAGAPFEALGVSPGDAPSQPLCAHRAHERAPAGRLSARGRHPWSWFGGGMDLTPYYGFEEDAAPLPPHLNADALAPHRGPSCYPRFKPLVRRVLLPQAPGNEPRGVGGMCSSTISTKAVSKTAFATDARRGRQLLCPAYLPHRAPPPRRGLMANASAISRPTGVGVTSSSTSSGTAARTSGCTAAAARKAS